MAVRQSTHRFYFIYLPYKTFKTLKTFSTYYLHIQKKSCTFARLNVRVTKFITTMKKNLLSILSILCVVSSYAVKLNGVEFTIDTLSMYPAGPGTTFYELRMLRADNGSNRLDCWLLAVDTKNPYVSVEEVLGTGKIIGTETPSNMAKRSSTDTKIFFAGSNGDFFVTQGDVGLPVGTTIVNNEYAHTPSGGLSRRAAGIDADGKGITSYKHSYALKLVTPDTTLKISHVNYNRLENELVLYNFHNGPTTKTNAYGTELKLELLPGENWQTTGTMKAKVLDKQTNVGSMALASNYVVLSAHGTMATELEKLNAGDEVTFDFEIRLDDKVVNVAQLIGGDNYEAILTDGVIITTNGYWNELHPRTGFGVSQTRDTVFMLVVDGRGVSKGCTTKVLAEILQHYGAYNAVNWDGGGSSCIYVKPFDQMNKGSDGKERACGNGMFAVANVPAVDNVVTAIAPYMPIYTLPRWGMAKPQFLGYNQYGVLVDTDVQGVVLSCDPALGEILPDGRFLLSGETGGVLKASLGDITTELDVRIAKSAPIAIRLDSVLCDATHPYKVEVEGTVGNNVVGLLADALTWSSENPAIATVNEKGEVLGVSNGRVNIIGKLGDFTDTIIANVEIPTANKMVWDDFRNAASWTIKQASGLSKPVLEVPTDAAAPVVMKFTYKTVRQPYLELVKDSVLYSIPEKIQIPITTDAIFSKVNVIIRQNNASQSQNIVFQDLKVGKENVLEINVAEVLGTDAAIFPLHFGGIKLFLDTKTEMGDRYITLPGIIEVFAEGSETAVDNLTMQEDGMRKFIENGTFYIQSESATYNVLGAQVK